MVAAGALILGIGKSLIAAELPKDLKWLSNETDPIYSDASAQKGCEFTNFILSFPPTLRFVGPDANNGFRDAITNNFFGLVERHPNTLNIVGVLATDWAYGADKKSMYFKLRQGATWSDGKPITADDYTFVLDFMRSKNIRDPWYNDYYTKFFEKIVKYDDYTISIHATKALPDLDQSIAINPLPRHFFKGQVDKDFVAKMNWEIIPNSGPYILTEIDKGKSLTLTRKQKWWGENLRYFKNRFNVDKVTYKVVREMKIAWEYFLKGKFDDYPLTFPDFWHEKSKIKEFENGYIHKLWFYNDRPRSPVGLYMNMDDPLLSDINVRKGISYAINVDKVINTILRSDYERLPRYTTGFGPYDNKNLKPLPFDIKEAKKYFALAGFKDMGPNGILHRGDQPLSVSLTYSSEQHTPRLVIFKEEARKAGLELDLQILDGTMAFKKVREKKYQMAYWAWAGNRLIPSYWEDMHSKNAHIAQTNNINNIAIKKLDDLIDQYEMESDETVKIKLSQEINEIYHTQYAFVPLFHVPYFRTAYWRWWKLPAVPATKRSQELFNVFDSMMGGMFWFDQKAYNETHTAMKAGKKLPKVEATDKTFRDKASFM